ncbi:MAG: hypothetical protein WBJ37_09440 [Bacteroidales bacterium]
MKFSIQDHDILITGKGWIGLDNAAKLFPAIISKDLTSVFRISVLLKEPVKYSVLNEAVEVITRRFPYFSVSLGSGMFWHFLEFNQLPPRIHYDEGTPCTAFAINRKNEPLYRILVCGRKISVEFFHVLTDGAGALEYLKSLLLTYFKFSGINVPDTQGILLPETPIDREEVEDAYNRYFTKLPPPQKLRKSWHLPFRVNRNIQLRKIQAEVSTGDMLNMARKYNVSLTEYFTSVYLYSLQKIYNSVRHYKAFSKRNVLRIEVPVNLRKRFPSKTMRNFSLFVMPEIDLSLGHYSFQEIVETVHHQMQLSTKDKQILRFLSSNVRYEKILLVRILPLFIKKIVMSMIYRGIASKRLTGLVTNLGQVVLPEKMAERVEHFEMLPTPPNRKLKVSCSLVSFRDRLIISFFNITGSNELERLILKHLSVDGIHVKLLNNK